MHILRTWVTSKIDFHSFSQQVMENMLKRPRSSRTESIAVANPTRSDGAQRSQCWSLVAHAEGRRSEETVMSLRNGKKSGCGSWEGFPSWEVFPTYISTYLSTYLSIYLSFFYLTLYPCFCISPNLCICIFPCVSRCLSFFLSISVYLSTCLSICLPVYLPISLSLFYLYIYLYLYLFLHFPI